MGWRRVVHKITGKDMRRYFQFQRAEKVIEITTAADGETLECVTLVEFGDVVDHISGKDPDEMTAKVHEWIGL